MDGAQIPESTGSGCAHAMSAATATRNLPERGEWDSGSRDV